MDIYNLLRQKTSEALLEVFKVEVASETIQLEQTSADYRGDITVIIFPLLKFSRRSPAETAEKIGMFLKNNVAEVANIEVVKGFLNIELSVDFWMNHLKTLIKSDHLPVEKNSKPLKYVIEYSSPNTNKPLHLGHVRNNLIGHSLSEILKARGHSVIKVNLVNDRGIHICKSMIAWKQFGNEETPVSVAKKGDHFVGDYYVLFDKKLKEETKSLIESGISEEEAVNQTNLMKQTRELLLNWETGEKETRNIWSKMNSWVYSGFEKTYSRLGISFDKIYYESETYLLGKKLIETGLTQNSFFRKEDNSVWVDLKDEGIDDKLLLRPDGTSVYITQDLGTAQLRYDDFHADKMIYIVGSEQEHHFNVLRLVLKKLGKSYYDSIYHLSYGMIDLPDGKMKSREGTVVDADDLMDEMYSTAYQYIAESGKLEEAGIEEKEKLSEVVGLAALKFFILKADVKKRMVFNPEESIDFQGHTGPFIQYTYARIKSVLRKANLVNTKEIDFNPDFQVNEFETELLKSIYYFNDALEKAERILDPSQICIYVYNLAKQYNKFYHECQILKEENTERKKFRLALSVSVAKIIKLFMNLLGIDVPEKM